MVEVVCSNSKISGQVTPERDVQNRFHRFAEHMSRKCALQFGVCSQPATTCSLRPSCSKRTLAQACFDANTGRYSSCMTLTRASDASGGGWTAVGLLMTKTHIVVTGSDGSIEWLALPTQPGGHLEVRSIIRDRLKLPWYKLTVAPSKHNCLGVH